MRLKNSFAPLTIIVGIVTFVTGALGLTLHLGTVTNTACRFEDVELCRFLDKGKTVNRLLKNGYIVKSTTIDAQGKKNEEVWEVAGENKAHVVNYEGGKETFNMIIIDNDLYVKDYLDGMWWKKPIDQAEKEGKLNIEKIVKNKQLEFKEIDGDISYQKLNGEKCRNSQCLRYKIVNNRSETDGDQYLLFDDQDYLLRKIQRQMANGSISEFTIDYELPTIEEPISAKEAADNQNVF